MKERMTSLVIMIDGGEINGERERKKKRSQNLTETKLKITSEGKTT